MKFMTPMSVKNLPSYMRDDRIRKEMRQKETLRQEKEQVKKRFNGFMAEVYELGESSKSPEDIQKAFPDIRKRYSDLPAEMQQAAVQAIMQYKNNIYQEEQRGNARTDREYALKVRGREEEKVNKAQKVTELGDRAYTETRQTPGVQSAPNSLDNILRGYSPGVQRTYMQGQKTAKDKATLDKLKRDEIQSKINKNNRMPSSGTKFSNRTLYKDGMKKTIYSQDGYNDATADGWKAETFSTGELKRRESNANSQAKAFITSLGGSPMDVMGDDNLFVIDNSGKDANKADTTLRRKLLSLGFNDPQISHSDGNIMVSPGAYDPYGKDKANVDLDTLETDLPEEKSSGVQSPWDKLTPQDEELDMQLKNTQSAILGQTEDKLNSSLQSLYQEKPQQNNYVEAAKQMLQKSGPSGMAAVASRS